LGRRKGKKGARRKQEPYFCRRPQKIGKVRNMNVVKAQIFTVIGLGKEQTWQ
jgi:hypothetical protein